MKSSRAGGKLSISRFSVVIDRFNDERLRCKEQALWAAYYLSKTGNYST
jgi:hypothetical protein